MVANHPDFPPPNGPAKNVIGTQPKPWEKPHATMQDVMGKPVEHGSLVDCKRKFPSMPGSTVEEIKEAIEKKMEDSCAVHKPSHYQILPGVEVIDVRKAILSKIYIPPSLYAIDCWSRSWEYLTRMWGKNGLEDAKKAKVYLEWLIEEMEKSEKNK